VKHCATRARAIGSSKAFASVAVVVLLTGCAAFAGKDTQDKPAKDYVALSTRDVDYVACVKAAYLKSTHSSRVITVTVRIKPGPLNKPPGSEESKDIEISPGAEKEIGCARDRNTANSWSFSITGARYK
jgi:hypothetical protein